MTKTVQFSGESPWDAIVHHNSLDMVEEDELLEFCHARGADVHTASLSDLERLFAEWCAERNVCTYCGDALPQPGTVFCSWECRAEVEGGVE